MCSYALAISAAVAPTCVYNTAMYRIAGIIRGGQFSREGEPFVLRGLFAGLKFADTIPPLCFARGPYSPAMFRGFIFRR